MNDITMLTWKKLVSGNGVPTEGYLVNDASMVHGALVVNGDRLWAR